jgi:hypothetical protein
VTLLFFILLPVLALVVIFYMFILALYIVASRPTPKPPKRGGMD